MCIYVYSKYILYIIYMCMCETVLSININTVDYSASSFEKKHATEPKKTNISLAIYLCIYINTKPFKEQALSHKIEDTSILSNL